MSGGSVSEDDDVSHDLGSMGKAKRTTLGPWLFAVGGVAALTALATVIAIRDDARGLISLEFLTPVVHVADEVGWWLLRQPLQNVLRGGFLAAAVAIVVGVVLWWNRRDVVARDLPPVLVALGLALAAQLLFLLDHPNFAVIGYAGAVLVVVVGSLIGRGGPRTESNKGLSRPPSYVEVSWLLLIGAVAVFFRYYALNRLFFYFEGELSPFMVGATNFEGMWLANIGWGGPWAPMGILYFLPIWAMVAVGGSTVLAVRLASAVIGVLTIVVVWVVVRGVIGRTAAIWSAALLAVDTLQVGWGRSDMHPHASTAWPGVLLYGATVRALAKGSTGWYIAVMLLMGLSWHQYPSGQFVIVVPLIAFAVHAAQNPGFLEATWRKGLWLVGGTVLWVLGYPLAHFIAVAEPTGPLQYVALLGPRIVGGSDAVIYEGVPIGELVSTVSRNSWDLVRGLVTEAPLIFHQTAIPEVADLHPRALPWFVVACAVVGITIVVVRLREQWSPPLLGLVIAGSLPAVLSDAAWLKRASVLYLALIIVASVPLAIVTDGLSKFAGRARRRFGALALVASFLLWSSVWTHLWFSEREYRFGVPAEAMIVEALEKHIAPNTILVAGLWGDYIEGEIVYLLYDAMSERQPIALYVANPLREGWRTLLAFPREAVKAIGEQPWYWLWLGLGDAIPEVVSHREWSRVVYLIEHRPDVASDIEALGDRCPELEIERVFVGEDDEVINGEVWKRYHVWIARCDHHRGLRTPRFAVPAPESNAVDELQ
jgi:hypothetical protein